MPRYTPKHRAAGNPLRDALVPDALAGTSRTASRAAISAAVTLPLATAVLGGGTAAYADDSVGSTGAAAQSASLLVRPDSSTALPPAYADVRTLVPGAQVAEPELAPQPGLVVRGGMELEPRTTSPSRSSERDAAGPEVAATKVEDKRWAREDVNLRLGPGERFKAAGALDFRDGVGVTGLTSGKWLQVKREGRSMWVHRAFMAKERPPKPEPVVVESTGTSESTESATSGSSAAPASSGVCSNGTSVSGGANVIAVHNAICAAFPSITSYGTYRADSTYHATGRAIDAMVSGDLGWQVAEYVRANASSLGVSEVIYAQQIWTVERSSEGWRPMEDRGSATANHFDHVHVSTY
ncbi:hypothetical protein KLP28_03390 [Nocardioidaceae bacterium]|nr:hypothetical protein KLP28_03390 [Nocardioidaceae bacterium]